LAAFVEPDEAARRAACVELHCDTAHGDYRPVMADRGIDAVVVATPSVHHCEIVLAAAAAGKHVLCEKPIALKTADADRMVQAAQRAGRLLMIAHVLPFFPEYRFAYRAITSGKYGALLGGHFKRIISDPLWLPDFYDPDKTGGPMIDLHIHDAHYIRLLCGMPQAVQSVGKMRGAVVERFNTQFLFENPDLVVTAASGVINQQGRSFTHGYEIYLEKATITFESAVIEDQGQTIMPLTVFLDKKGKVLRPELGGGDAFVEELTEAVRAVRSGEPSPLLAGELARDALVLGNRQTQSVTRRKAVKV
jgi:predicted dehydrogenase